jgi:hypothetical protein
VDVHFYHIYAIAVIFGKHLKWVLVHFLTSISHKTHSFSKRIPDKDQGKRFILQLHKNLGTGVYQLLFWINFWGCPGYLKITVTRLWPRFESYHGIFFPYTFFIHFIKFSSAVEMSSSIQNFSPINFFFVIEIQCFLF